MKQIRHLFLVLLTVLLMPQAAMAEYYGIKVGGVSVTSDNCNNITGSNIKAFLDGMPHASYDPSTKTLTLDNILIERSGSGNRAILNESCNGLTIRFISPCAMNSPNASPLRFNANTTITGISMERVQEGIYWNSCIFVKGDYEDCITVGNGASLTFTNCPPMWIGAEHSNGIIGDTGSETLTITDCEGLRLYQGGVAYHDNVKWAGINNFVSVFVENSYVPITYQSSARAVMNVKNFFLSSNMMAKTFYLSDGYAAHFDNDGKIFVFRPDWDDEDYVVTGDLDLVPFIPIDEAHFPDDNFRAYVKEEKDDRPADGRLDQQEANVFSSSETNKSVYYVTIDVTGRDISSLKGIEYFPELEILNITRNNITELDLSPFKYLLKLVTTSNPLKSLDVTKSPQLRNLRCDYNQLTRLDLSKSDSLIFLNCTNNLLTYLDFSHCNELWEIWMGGNRIDTWMTETLESLPVTSSGSIYISSIYDTGIDNTCTDEQADIARQKGWNVTIRNIDDDGNMYYPIKIAGQYITSATKNDLTVLPYVTKNCDSGYAYYDSNKNELHLSGVDIVAPDSLNEYTLEVGMKSDFSIKLGMNPVNIVNNIFSESGIHVDSSSKTFSITSEGNTTSQLNVTTRGYAIYTSSPLVIGGYTKVTLTSEKRTPLTCASCNLTMKEHAELQLVTDSYSEPLWMRGNGTIYGDIIYEDGIGIVSPVGAYYDKSQGFIVDKDGNELKGEVLFGQPKNYDLYIAGTRVNTSNLSDVLGDGGSVCFNGVDRLTLTNANIDGGTSQYGINSLIPLDIVLNGENNVNGSVGISFEKETHIKGPGKLNATGKYGIYSNTPIFYIEDGAQVKAEGTERYGMGKRYSSAEEVVIRGEETIVELKGVRGAVDFKRLTLEDGLQIALPKGAYFRDEWDGIVRASGSTIKNEWVTIAGQDFVDAHNTDAYGNTIYNIAFAGDTITSAIASDLTVLPAISLNTEGGYARYDASDNSLHLSGVDIEVDAETKAHALDISTFRDATIVLGNDPVCIYNNYFDSYDLTFGTQGIHRSGNVQSHLTITTEKWADADGSLTISTEGYSFLAQCGVTIAGRAKVNIESARKSAFSLTEAIGSALTLKEDAGLTLTAMQEPMWMTYNCQLIMEDGIGIMKPLGASYSEDKRSLVDAEEQRLSNTTVIIGKSMGYGIYIAGTEVNNTNQNDVLGDGSVSYNPETSVLSLRNADIDGGTAEYGILAYAPITLTVEGENEVKGIYGLYVNDQTTIGGTGSLSFQGETGIYSSAPGITIEGGIHLYAEGTAGIGMAGKNASAGGITVRGEETIVEMKGTEGALKANSLTLGEGMAILPTEAHIDDCTFYNPSADETEEGRGLVGADGNPIKNQWIVIASQDYITGVKDLKDLKDSKDSFFNLAGQRVGKGYKGIAVTKGRKVLKK
ncbi:MAG: hypothetical protein J6I86_00810 [Bacteroidaceae bacterium]|nr:hypothetical protein [Bacteroidaceae bacterium]